MGICVHSTHLVSFKCRKSICTSSRRFLWFCWILLDSLILLLFSMFAKNIKQFRLVNNIKTFWLQNTHFIYFFYNRWLWIVLPLSCFVPHASLVLTTACWARWDGSVFLGGRKTNVFMMKWLRSLLYLALVRLMETCNFYLNSSAPPSIFFRRFNNRFTQRHCDGLHPFCLLQALKCLCSVHETRSEVHWRQVCEKGPKALELNYDLKRSTNDNTVSHPWPT